MIIQSTGMTGKLVAEMGASKEGAPLGWGITVEGQHLELGLNVEGVPLEWGTTVEGKHLG